jgi:uncharacterized phage protein (TIGR02220 family)
VSHFILNKKIIAEGSLEAALILSYLTERRLEAQVKKEEFFSIIFYKLEADLNLKRRKREKAFAFLEENSYVKIIKKHSVKCQKIVDVRISILRNEYDESVESSRCYKLHRDGAINYTVNPERPINVGAINYTVKPLRSVASMYSFNILKYIKLKTSKSFIGINSNLPADRKSILKFIKKDSFVNETSSKVEASSPLIKKQLEMKVKVETNTKLSTNKMKSQNELILAQEIIAYLNEKTGKNFRHNANGNLKFIKARIKEKYTLKDFKKVIDLKVDEWSDTIFSNGTPGKNYLRPQTLFNEKFDSYLNESKEESLDDRLEAFFKKSGCKPS